MADKAYFYRLSFPIIADLGEGWALVATEGGPAICGNGTLSALDPLDCDDASISRAKRIAVRKYREWSWKLIDQKHKDTPHGYSNPAAHVARH